jgi:hypothetical protein
LPLQRETNKRLEELNMSQLAQEISARFNELGVEIPIGEIEGTKGRSTQKRC